MSRVQRKYLGRDSTAYVSRKAREEAYLAAVPERLAKEIDRLAEQNRQREVEDGRPSGWHVGSVGSIVGFSDCECFFKIATPEGVRRCFRPSYWCRNHGPRQVRLDVGKVVLTMGTVGPGWRLARVRRTREKPSREGFWWLQADGSWIVIQPSSGGVGGKRLEDEILKAVLGMDCAPRPESDEEKEFDPRRVTYSLPQEDERRVFAKHGLTVKPDGTWASGPLTDEQFRAFACDVSPWYRRRLRSWIEQHRPLAA